jgi:hypothetical protein
MDQYKYKYNVLLLQSATIVQPYIMVLLLYNCRIVFVLHPQRTGTYGPSPFRVVRFQRAKEQTQSGLGCFCPANGEIIRTGEGGVSRFSTRVCRRRRQSFPWCQL